MSTTTRTETKQAHTRRHPCEVCNSYDEAPRGKGIRCAGFTIGTACFCTRSECAGGLPLVTSTSPPSYKHRLAGPCDCGTEHEPGRAAVGNGRPGCLGEPVAVYDYRDECGVLLFQACRYLTDDGGKTFRFRRPNGNGEWTWNLGDKPSVLYRLPEIHAADPALPVFVVEGEKDVDTLHALGLVATTNPMGAGKWREACADELRGRRAVVLQDNDEAGRRHALEVAHSLQGKAASVKVLPPFPDVGEHGDVSDWLNSGHTVEELLLLVENTPRWEPTSTSPPAGKTQPDPQLELPVREGPELNPAALHGPAGEIVKRIALNSEADPAALLGQLLVAAGNIIGRGPHFSVEADQHFANLFMVIVGPTGVGRKGTAFGYTRRIAAEIDPDWAHSRIQGGLSSGEGLIWSVRDAIEDQEPIRNQEKEITGYRPVVRDHGVSDKRALFYEPEFSGPLRVMRREGNQLSATIRQAFDTGRLQIATKNSPATATGAHISIVGHITQEELARDLDLTSVANGLANRFLWVWARRPRLLPRGSRFEAEAVHDLIAQLRKAVQFSPSVGEVPRDDKAWALWEDLYSQLTAPAPGLMGALASRADALVTRLSLIYALLDGSDVVRFEHLGSAMLFWEYCAASVRYVFGDRLRDPVAEAILAFLGERGSGGATQTGIHDHLQRHVSAQEIARALQMLESQTLVVRRREPTGGRTATRWFIAKQAPAN